MVALLAWCVSFALCHLSHGRTLQSSNAAAKYDFANLRQVIAKVLSEDNLSLYRQRCQPLNVTMPETSIMITYANLPSFVLVELQFRAMDLWTPGLRQCLNTKYVILCTDKEAFNQCSLSGFMNCALVVVPSLGEYSPQFSAGFFAFSFFKYEVIIESLALAKEMFFFDADILMFKTPWIDDNGLYKFDDTTGKRIEPTYEFMYQRERGSNFDCDGKDVNGGQYYFRNTTASHNFLETMLTFREKILSYQDKKFDQDYVTEAIMRSGVKTCGLNHYRFASGWQAYYFMSTDDLGVDALVTFHFDGLNGNKGQARINRMKAMMEKIKNNPQIKLRDVFDKRAYFSSVG